MSERPKNMDEFAAGMRAAAAERAEQVGLRSVAACLRTHLPPHEEDEVSDVLILEAAIAYVREQFEFVEGIGFGSPNQKPVQDFTFYGRGDTHEEGWQKHPRYRTCVLAAKPAPEPEPPDAVREAAIKARDFLRATFGPNSECGPVIGELDAALDADA